MRAFDRPRGRMSDKLTDYNGFIRIFTTLSSGTTIFRPSLSSAEPFTTAPGADPSEAADRRATSIAALRLKAKQHAVHVTDVNDKTRIPHDQEQFQP